MRGHAVAALVLMAGNACAQVPAATVVKAEGETVVFNGQINAVSAAQFLQLLEEGKRTRLVITSAGGNVAAALDMALAIHERELDVEVPTACLSSCANYIFPAGRRKTIGHPEVVGWHGNMTHVLYLEQTGQQRWTASEMDSARRLAVRESDFYSRIGVDGFVAWFAKLPPYGIDDFYWLPVQDMERFGIRKVTVLDASPRQPQNPELSRVQVDWDALEAIRPEVRLNP